VRYITDWARFPRDNENEFHFHYRELIVIPNQRFRHPVLLFLLTACIGTQTFGQAATSQFSAMSSAASAASGPIQDNSFLVEEAYNQEDGVIQHISCFERVGKDWNYTFTDEWPLRSLKHQFSTTVAANHSGKFGGVGIGDTALNYRYQLIGTGETKLAMAPRFSLVIPSGDAATGRGFGGTGLQSNLPISIVHGKYLVTHWNAGVTWIPHARNSAGERAGTVGMNLGQSFIWQFSNRVNGMLETVWTSTEEVVAEGKTARSQDIFISPGVRWAYNFRSGLQVVPGVAVPIGAGPSRGQKGLVLYLSFEHPFGWSHSR
jgi:hypothetical protein